jgi:hypothetical protein
MKTISPFAGPEVSDLVSQIQLDQQGFSSENRSGHREPLVMPINIETSLDEFGLDAFTRNISPEGICLIAPQPFRPLSEASIRLMSGTFPKRVASTCRWNKKFGMSYWISGWQMNAQLPVGKILKEDHQVEFDYRTNFRLKTAVPVSIHQDFQPKRIAGFTRNLSDDGICLVSKEAVEVGRTGVLEIMRLNGDSNGVVANCIWAKPYAQGHWVSGWEFARAPE